MRSARMFSLLVSLWLFAGTSGTVSQSRSTTLDIYFIDTEGGQATLIISPVNGILGTKEVLLLDAGNLNPPGRDADRIVAAMKDAGVERVDTLVVSHYHGDHVGGVAALFDKVPVRRVLDPGAFVPEQNGTREAGYLSYLPVRQHAHVMTPRPGTKIPVAGLEVHVVSSAGDLMTAPLPGVRRAANPLCASAERRAQDNTPNNFESIGVLIEFGGWYCPLTKWENHFLETAGRAGYSGGFDP